MQDNFSKRKGVVENRIALPSLIKSGTAMKNKYCEELK